MPALSELMHCRTQKGAAPSHQHLIKPQTPWLSKHGSQGAGSCLSVHRPRKHLPKLVCSQEGRWKLRKEAIKIRMEEIYITAGGVGSQQQVGSSDGQCGER